jgi:hypothetical protein
MTRIVLSCAIVATLLVGGCGKTLEQKKIEDVARKAEEAGKALEQGTRGMADALKGLGDAANDGKKVEPVDFRELKALLPEKLSGMTREGAEGERAAAMGINMSEAHANYVSSTGAASATIKITDMGSVSGLVGMATMAWAFTDVDRETETTYERTTTFDGHKAFEKYDTQGRNAELNILVERRFVVTIEGSDVEMTFLKEAARSIDLSKLASMKNAGIAS